MPQLNTRVTDDLIWTLRDESKKRGVPMSELMRQALEAFLDVSIPEKAPKPKREKKAARKPSPPPQKSSGPSQEFIESIAAELPQPTVLQLANRAHISQASAKRYLENGKVSWSNGKLVIDGLPGAF